MCLYPRISTRAPGKFSRNSRSAGKVRMKSPSAPPRMTRIRASVPGDELMPDGGGRLLGAGGEAAHRPFAFPALGAIPRDVAHVVGILGFVVARTAAEQEAQRGGQQNPED